MIEEEFFKTFEIEPKKLCFNGDCIVKDDIGYNDKICDDRCVYITKKYPRITDRRLLELICIIVSVQTSYAINEDNYKKLKKKVLQRAISLKNYIAQDVKSLFEGVEK